MTIQHVVYRMATDSVFADHIQHAPRTTLAAHGLNLDEGAIEAIIAVLHGKQPWQALHDPAAGDAANYMWGGAPSMAAADLHSVLDGLSSDTGFGNVLHAAVAPKCTASASSASARLMALPGLCCAVLGGQAAQIQPLLNAWVLLYTALHLLDNIEDGDVPDGAWAQWGTGPTINITTGLLASTNLALDALYETHPRAARAILHDFNRTLLHMCAGQHDDLTVEQPSLDQCWQIAEGKSAIFFALACRAGARLANEDAQQIEDLAQFGHHLGLLIQIGDDLSGLWSTSTEQSDLRSAARWTLPVAYAMSVADPAEREQLQTYLAAAASDPSAEAAARQMIIKLGAVLYLSTEAQRHVRAAQRSLLQAALPVDARAQLLALLHDLTPATSDTPRALPVGITITHGPSTIAPSA